LTFGGISYIEKCTDVTYRVECGNKGKSQIIHAYRMRKGNPQILGGETEQPSDSVEEDSGESVKSEDLFLY
jgi:hypothetical protein